VNYCPHTDVFTVAAAPLCSVGFHTNFLGTSCAICPGNNANTKSFSNTCSLHGQCTYSTCSTTLARCICNPPYVGAACQWNPNTDHFTLVTITNKAFTVSLNDVNETSGNVVYSVPSNFVANTDVGGSVIVAAYTNTNKVFVNPFTAPPATTNATSIGWRFEVTCPDNTYDSSTFGNSVGVVIPVDPTQINQFDLALSELYYYDVTISSWQLATKYCASSQTYYDVDFALRTISTTFCRPGQYNIFIAPPPPLGANTGHSFNPFPAPTIVSGAFPTTGLTGSNPIPPPLPVFTAVVADPSPHREVIVDPFNSSSLISYSSILIALLLIVFF